MTATLLTVSGTLSIADGSAPSGGGVATVKVVDAEGEVLAASALEVDRLPAPFSLTVDPTLTPDPSALQVWAFLRAGTAGWGTLELVDAGADDVGVVLTRIDD
ncbi:hypothetical protein HMPREF0063_10352 [Aeromicrobium marinum DSM 15272]|uniref:Uncharacterized protein n=1 Tax=Aeromicrobium marinum DSM 15272 TaxID=585531 RepID=E2S8J5_9ACTN|nr:YbaY family lipoprotein [Aeromicrobium marinum]EFQ84500.1 hypothetical protein HMPREF0063_10352 [Aeromicrobium marinum DSM 15272]